MSDAASIGSRQYLTTRAIFSDRNADPPASRRTLLPSDGPVRFSGAPAALADEILEQHHCPARHFPKFGADAYVVDMVGILVLREIGVLIVSIMGLDGPELGSMKMREEIDACRIVNARMFRATAHAEVTDAPGAAAARDEAFGKAATKLVIWTSEVI